MNNPLLLIPECNEDGSYKALQCHPDSVGGGRFCQCWTPEGAIITSPSQKTKACECHVQKHQSLVTSGFLIHGEPMLGGFMPSCHDDGTFHEKQCHGSTGHCWCVDPMTGAKKGESVGPGGELTC